MTEKHLSHTCWNLWTSILWWTFGVCALLAVIPWLVTLAAGRPSHPLLFIPAGVIVIGLSGHLYMRAYWRRFRFTYDDRQMRVFSGLWWRKQVLIPFARITNIDLMQGPWQRSRKLATLKIQTAGQGGTATAETRLWSQDNFEELRDELLKRVVRMRTQITGDGTTDELQGVEGEAPWDEIVRILKRIEENTRPSNVN